VGLRSCCGLTRHLLRPTLWAIAPRRWASAPAAASPGTSCAQPCGPSLRDGGPSLLLRPHQAPPAPDPAGHRCAMVDLRSCFGLTRHLLRPTLRAIAVRRWAFAPASASFGTSCARPCGLRQGQPLPVLGARGA